MAASRQAMSRRSAAMKVTAGFILRARDRRQHGDQHKQNGPGRDRVRPQGDPDIAARQPLGHDSRADHRSEQHERADPFRHNLAIDGCRALDVEFGHNIPLVDIAATINSSSRRCKKLRHATARYANWRM